MKPMFPSFDHDDFRTSLLMRFYETKKTEGHTDPDSPPPAPCSRCLNHRKRVWQEVDSKRGFWMVEAHCHSCAELADISTLRLRLRKRYEKAGIPAMFQNCTLRPTAQEGDRQVLIPKHFQRDAFLKGRHYKSPGWLCLGGHTGTGKTTIASALMCDLIDHDKLNRSFMWSTEYALFRRADLASEKGHSFRIKVLQQVIDTDVLMLDDLGGSRRNMTPWQAGAFRDLIDERHREQRPTLLTTNMRGWGEMSERYGEHIVSRLLEASTEIIIVDGPDLRISGDSDDDG